jgi:hypothetical protein
MTKTTLYCGFCGKSQHEVAQLVAWPSVHTDLCYQICNPPPASQSRHAVIDAIWDKIRDVRRSLDEVAVAALYFLGARERAGGAARPHTVLQVDCEDRSVSNTPYRSAHENVDIYQAGFRTDNSYFAPPPQLREILT